MANNARFAEVASLAGDPTRAAMLHALMDGRALTASELARVAGITPQTASGHLARMAAAGLVQVEQQGRHRYHRLATPAVAQMIESIMQVAAGVEAMRPAPATGPRDAVLRAARTCYAHIAGHLGVAITDALVRAGCVELTQDAGLVTDSGIALFERIGIDVAALDAHRGKATRVLCRPCLDWSEPGRRTRRGTVRTQFRRRLDMPCRGHARDHGHAARMAPVSRRHRRAARRSMIGAGKDEGMPV
jgi:DNA-binding transcriptional ArsR family regulator